jgi:VWFA-related protein
LERLSFQILLTLLTGLLLGAAIWAQSTNPAKAEDQPETLIRAHADAVLLDLVVRDKKGRPVKNLRPEEVLIYENGVKQDLLTFRNRSETVVGEVEEGEASSEVRGEADEASETLGAAPSPAPEAPVSFPNLVTLVFDKLSLEARQLSRRGALDFLEEGVGENTFVSVFAIDQVLHIVQPFTEDLELLQTAVGRVTSGEFSQFASESEAVALALREQTSASAAGQGAVASVGRGSSSAGRGSNFAAAEMAGMQLNMLAHFEQLTRGQQGIASIHGLLALVSEQGQLAGRKTVIHFSEGLHVPPFLVDRFRTMISEANRANVSIYAVDARGLNSAGLMTGTNVRLSRATWATKNQLLFGYGKAVTREQVMAIENAEASLKMNLQGTLADLAESTGGVLIANSNDVRPAVRQIREDLQIYYEASYMPKGIEYDGSFREIRVEVTRPDVTVQSRNGYFAMPVFDDTGPALFPYEVPMMVALSADPHPSDLYFRSRSVRFHKDGNEYHYTFVMEVPLANFTFEEHPESETYSTRFSLMALLKDPHGKVVRKISQDYPLVGPLDKVDDLKQSDIVLIRHLRVPPGRYRVEVVAFDRESGRAGVSRSLLLVRPQNPELSMSGLSVIRRIDPINNEERDDIETDNPFIVKSGKIVPDLIGSIRKGSGGDLSLFLVVYPSNKSTEPPKLTFQLMRDGKVVGQSTLELPDANEKGEIPYVATVPIEDLDPGRYEVRAVVLQGESSVSEHGFFTIESQAESGLGST